jgi:hypothetical protein
MSKLRPGQRRYVTGIYINGYVQRETVEIRLIQRIPGGRWTAAKWKVEAPYSFVFGVPPMFTKDYPCELFVEEKNILTRDEAIAKKLMQ